METDYIKIISHHTSTIDAVTNLFVAKGVSMPTGCILLMHMLAQALAVMCFEEEKNLKEEIAKAMDLIQLMGQLADVLIREKGKRV
jgi:hypothetical protein